jgi:hypothetical protein
VKFRTSTEWITSDSVAMVRAHGVSIDSPVSNNPIRDRHCIGLGFIIIVIIVIVVVLVFLGNCFQTTLSWVRSVDRVEGPVIIGVPPGLDIFVQSVIFRRDRAPWLRASPEPLSPVCPELI